MKSSNLSEEACFPFLPPPAQFLFLLSLFFAQIWDLSLKYHLPLKKGFPQISGNPWSLSLFNSKALGVPELVTILVNTGQGASRGDTSLRDI